MRVLLIDNYDSFTYNLVQYLGELGAELDVVRNDAATVDELVERARDGRASSRPGRARRPRPACRWPRSARSREDGMPVLGVCLGHQAMAEAFGGKVVAQEPVHGKTADRRARRQDDLRGPRQARWRPGATTRWSSTPTLPDCLEVSAHGGDVLMGIRHRELPAEGVQFHPESILTGSGKACSRTSSSASS